MEALFENQKLKVTYLGTCDEDIKNKTHIFTINIKEFDTPPLNVEYDDNDKVIIRTWIEEEEDENGPKSHVIYKLFSLIEFEVSEIMQFIIRHI
ncbi:hypothetical protein EAI30_02990 [Romboutsia ilealis]|uniref:Uncharacterized protein n=1 Tax=Romboutsia faecis TaxID=2764597 RepID=A0ABR7JQV7_9FIRM|nr:hypothetical protein [Romboutsia faecis]MBC5997293.1 hypothetical protein [Romboutsia faecis]MRN23575.1 hypothetical protein [Romboutsia ilealis]